MRERCGELLRGLRAAVPYHAATVWARADRRLVPAASVGRPMDLLEGVPFGEAFGLRAWVLLTGRVVRIPSKKGRGLRDPLLRGFLALPVERDGVRLGVLTLARAAGEFTEEDEQRAREAAGELARVLAEGRGGA